jgi:hypothetical protein
MATYQNLRELQKQSLERHNETEISRLCKEYGNNIKISKHGVQLGPYYEKGDIGGLKWRTVALTKILIDTKILKEDDVFTAGKMTRGAAAKREIRGIIRDMHPLGKNANSAIVIAFTETWFRNMIVDIISKPGENRLELGAMKVEPHLPLIISSLRHEAVQARRKLIVENKDVAPQKKFLVTTHLRRPWVRLCAEENVGGNRTKIILSFEVEDFRLARPELYYTEDFEPLFVKRRKNGGQTPAGFTAGVKTEVVPLGEMRSVRNEQYEWEEEIDVG